MLQRFHFICKNTKNSGSHYPATPRIFSPIEDYLRPADELLLLELLVLLEELRRFELLELLVLDPLLRLLLEPLPTLLLELGVPLLELLLGRFTPLLPVRPLEELLLVPLGRVVLLGRLTLPLELLLGREVPLLELLLGRLTEPLPLLEGVLPLSGFTLGVSLPGPGAGLAGVLPWCPDMLPASGFGLTVALGAGSPPPLCGAGGVTSWVAG